jgi:pyruvate/2-oxoglutarate dehydrogenase complex dihydrolipoamide acyltransferase (E2) component
VPDKANRGYQVVPFPRSRLIVIDTLRLAHRKHLVHGLVEVDVTHARDLIHCHKAATGESLSFTAFVIGCLGRAVGENRMVQAYRNWRGRLVLFDDVDVSAIIESKLEGASFPLAHVLRAANRRSLRDLHEEIRAIQANPRSSAGFKQWWFMPILLHLPAAIRLVFWRALFRMPNQVKAMAGTVSVTAIGMFGQGAGWAITLPIYTLSVALGGIAQKTVVVDGQVAVREVLSVTLTFDHDIVDGAPAARFAQRFRELVESGYGLEETLAAAY